MPLTINDIAQGLKGFNQTKNKGVSMADVTCFPQVGLGRDVLSVYSSVDIN
jgi:hypothetical protein